MKQRFPYRILDLVGSGQFGKVYLALNLQTKQLVALKQLQKKRLSTKKFLRELYCLVMLPHPHVISCNGVENYGDYRYLVLKYCEAGTLRTLINSSTKINLFQILEIISQILSALQYAHNKKIIHRDIKPENILLSLNNSGWTAYLSDFGIAELEQEINENGLGFTGSPAYIAPEIFYGKYSYSCDIYAVGILLFELIVGKRPFLGTPKELLTAHINQPIKIPETVPFIVRNIIFKALAKLPHLRFSSAEAMAKSVKLAQEFLTVTEPNISLFLKENNQKVGLLPIINKKTLSQKVNKIAINTEQIYIVKENTIEYYSYEKRDFLEKTSEIIKINIDGTVTKFNLHDRGYFFLCQSLNKFFLKYISFEDFKHNNISVTTNSLITDINIKKDLTISYVCLDRDKAIFQTLSLPKLKVIASWNYPPQIQSKNWNSLPKKLITLDYRYGLAFYENEEKSETSIQVFNRRGNWVANFSLATALHSITTNEAMNCLLALDFYNPNIGLLINLKPFQITRIALPIAPCFIISQQNNFIISDRKGNVVVYNIENGAISQWQLPLEKDYLLTAIAVSENSEILAATWCEPQSKGTLYSGSFPNGDRATE